MDQSLKNCLSLDALNEIISKGLSPDLVTSYKKMSKLTLQNNDGYCTDGEHSKVWINEISDINRLNGIIAEDSWATELSTLACQRMIDLIAISTNTEETIDKVQQPQEDIDHNIGNLNKREIRLNKNR